MWKIGNIDIKNKVVLAPMAGVSNAAYMKICEEMGVGYAITELISSEAIVRENKKTMDMLKGYEKLKIPVAIQIFGSNKENMAKAAQIIEKEYPNKIIDINMGCPVPKVAARANAGSALLKDPKKASEIVSEVVSSVSVPVTVKIRSGWDSNSINAIEIAKAVEKAGASAITIHGRTRSQGYSGKADLEIIKKVKENVSIPVIGNGDIKSPDDAKNMLDYTNCDAIMIGRGLLGNPWLIKNTIKYLNGEKELHEPTILDKKNMIKKHLEYLLEIKSSKSALLEMRTNAAYYLKGIPGSAPLKTEIFKTKTKEQFINVIDKIHE